MTYIYILNLLNVVDVTADILISSLFFALMRCCAIVVMRGQY